MSVPNNGLTQGEVETIVENAITHGVVSVQYIGSAPREITINDADTGEIIFNAVKGPTDDAKDLIRRVVSGWQEQADIDPGQQADLAENRQELEQQFNIDLPDVPQPTEGTETVPEHDLSDAEQMFMQQLETAMEAARFPWMDEATAPATVRETDDGFQIRPVDEKVDAVAGYFDDPADVKNIVVTQGRDQSPGETIIEYLAQLTFELTREYSGQIDIEAAQDALGAEARDEARTADDVAVADELGVEVMPPGEARELVEEAAAEATEGDVADGETGTEFIQRLKTAGNQVMQNSFGTPVVEVIVPEDMEAEARDVIDKWDIDPSGHDVMAQSPSFADERPEVAADLVSWQFYLEDPEDLQSSGFDLASIVNELEDDTVLFSTSPSVQASLS